MRAGSGATTTVEDGGWSAVGGERSGRRRRSTSPIGEVAKVLALSHYDPARDYQTGLQQARRPGPGDRAERIELPAVIAADGAKAMVEAMMARAEAGRLRRTVTGSTAALAIAPGERVVIEGENGDWRVDAVTVERMAVTLELVPIMPGGAIRGAPADPGRAASAPDLVAGATVLHAFETPALDDAVLDTPRLTIVAAGTGAGWRGAALVLSSDDAASWQEIGATAAPGVIGSVVQAPAAGSALMLDLVADVEVALLRDDMVLGHADDAAFDRGVNLALVGDELMQFGCAVPLGGGRWRLSRLLRGRRGTEAAIGTTIAGDRFVLLDEASARTVDLPLTTLGRMVDVLASGRGDEVAVAARATVTGRSVTPPAPVAVTIARSADGDVVLHWTRRSRAGWRWIDGADAPLAEEDERYLVEIEGPGATRQVETTTTTAVLDAGDVEAWSRVTVRQLGTNGASPPATVVVPLR